VSINHLALGMAFRVFDTDDNKFIDPAVSDMMMMMMMMMMMI
jgi:hypothetical protein